MNLKTASLVQAPSADFFFVHELGNPPWLGVIVNSQGFGHTLSCICDPDYLESGNKIQTFRGYGGIGVGVHKRDGLYK